MPTRKSNKVEEIEKKLQEVAILQKQGKTISETCKLISLSEPTYCRWKKKYVGSDATQAKRLADIEKENEKLKKLVEDLLLDNAILKTVVSKK